MVGAGLAGLAAASTLARRGIDVVLFERARRAGGRLAGERRDGFVLEPAAPVLSTGDRSLGRWLAEIGCEDELLVHRSGAEGQLRGGHVYELDPDPTRSLAARIGWLGTLRARRLERLLRRFRLDPSSPESAATRDDRSLADFALLYFGGRALESWAGPETTCDCLGEEEETSRVLFLLRHQTRRGETQALFRSGSGDFAEALAKRIGPRLGSQVEAIETGGPGGVLARFREGEVEGTMGADAAILATTAPEILPLARTILSPAEQEVLHATRYQPAVSLEVALGDPLVPRFLRIRVPRSEGWPVASIAIEPGRAGGRVPDGCAVARIVARSDWSRAHIDAPDDVLEKELLRWLVRLQPAAAEKVRFARVARWPLGLPSFGVGRYRALARWARVQQDQIASGRRVYFAGDWLVAPSAEGAVTSGLLAAESVIADLGF